MARAREGRLGAEGVSVGEELIDVEEDRVGLHGPLHETLAADEVPHRGSLRREELSADATVAASFPSTSPTGERGQTERHEWERERNGKWHELLLPRWEKTAMGRRLCREK